MVSVPTGTPSIEDNPNKEPSPETVKSDIPSPPEKKEEEGASRPDTEVEKPSKAKKVAGVAVKGLSLATKLGLLGGTGGTVAIALGVLGWWRRRRAAKKPPKTESWPDIGVGIPMPEEVEPYSGAIVQRDGSDRIVTPEGKPEEDTGLLLDLYREVVEKIASGENKDAVARGVGQQQLKYVAERFARLRNVIK